MGWTGMVTNEQLIDEVRRRFGGRFAIITDDDVMECLANDGCELTAKNIEEVWRKIGTTELADSMVEAGWDVIYYAIGRAGDVLTFQEA